MDDFDGEGRLPAEVAKVFGLRAADLLARQWLRRRHLRPRRPPSPELYSGDTAMKLFAAESLRLRAVMYANCDAVRGQIVRKQPKRTLK
jgi:hypothetical protein